MDRMEKSKVIKISVVVPNNDKNGVSVGHVGEAVIAHFAKAFGGVSWAATSGAWFDENGTLCNDESRTIWTFAPDTENARKTARMVARYVRMVARQDCVLMVIEPAHVEFI